MWQVLVKPLLNALIIGFGGTLLAIIASRIVGRALARPLGVGWSKFVANLVALGIAIWTVTLILRSAGAAGLAVVIITAITGAFAIGSERIAGDMVSGLSLFIQRNYAVGDIVLIAGHQGQVVAISLMTTTLENLSGERIFIRNSDVTSSIIVNYSSQSQHLISVSVQVSASKDVEPIQK